MKKWTDLTDEERATIVRRARRWTVSQQRTAAKVLVVLALSSAALLAVMEVAGEVASSKTAIIFLAIDVVVLAVAIWPGFDFDVGDDPKDKRWQR